MSINPKDIPVALRSLAIWTGSFVWMGTVAAMTGVGMFFVPYPKLNNGFLRPMFGRTVLFSGAQVEQEHVAELDLSRPTLYCQNHVNIMDGHLAAYVIRQPFSGMMNASHFRIPGYGHIMRLARGIPVYPRSSGRTAEITKAARARAAEGLSILCFPEAHRTLDGKVQPFKRGVFFMARDAGMPVVPIAVHGFYDVARKGSWLLRPGKVRVQMGPQLETAGLSDEALNVLVARVHEMISRFAEDGVSMADTIAEQERRIAAGGTGAPPVGPGTNEEQTT